ncbi:hypothetical protein [Nocardia farcinica]|uniref:Uncharacterized protein n=1 Tax=Nocardia farcinica (strain IFM 10152) TaxID=247156 RepID=Q5YP25_NOCFA|nr:hypothetical protein [Nocardia farcinica]MBF6071118.1 hypothetical protein [Nocardia farcinica]MBF6141195.1 hypothetical protein [Nocardia farcinica]MBF6232058.1 hypothetical protein [Nocardia farcinica]MBF6254810.1 hypothetical protein [Nocardia farcinica]MBF6269489.1 hypothetical protein [Nocardia farcinica]
MAVPDTGQGVARGLYAAAVDERFELAEDVAVNLAAACDKLVEDLGAALTASEAAAAVSGFPDLPTGRALAAGFAAKGGQLRATVAAFQETALLFKAAYLAAGHRLAEAEAAHRAALHAVADYLDQR